MTNSKDDPFLYPNRDRSETARGVSRRRMLVGSAAAGAAATAGCAGGGEGGSGNESEGGSEGADGGGTATETDPGDAPTPASERPTVFVFNTGDGTVSVVDAESDEVVGTRALGLSSSFPSNQYNPRLTTAPEDSLWLNVGRGVRALSVGSLAETAAVETESGANWLERTPNGKHVVVSAREPAHRQFRIDADPASEGFGEVTGDIDRTGEETTGGQAGPGPCDVTIHPDGEFAYVPDLFGDTLTVLRIDPFEIETQVDVEPVGAGPARPWMGTVSPDGETLLVEHNEGETGTESLWDLSDPANPEERVRLTGEKGLGRRPLTSEIGPDSETGYVFTPGSDDATVVDLVAGEVTGRLDLGGSAFVGTWDPAHAKLYVPVQTNDEVAVIDHARGEIVERIAVGAKPYGATAALARPRPDSTAALGAAMAQLGIWTSVETTYCIGNCACGHRL
ncbi:hypothetical protein NDI76_03980 [Halogeometricum sp. S1BR25-6]|uniref:40-residue YVTN family beta-propeller repeat-containing protein n=1 Tax=Halogeometricum salsisoli TaxID=2950536 RepID=A0ABU2GBP3_9EURY|nr:hypothetical protein [Halogeometricum sp. S1BR25-6]MDS0297891.1 hypothetical protein [Halogeometricum sp. S1BR25-6]